jgi:alkylation response protein AidB-like acyl-CoA dehydrogenase
MTELELARELAQQFALRADAADRQGRLPAEDVTVLRDSGYLTLSVPKAYGGWGLGLRDCVAAQLELAQGSSSTAMVATMPLHLIGSAGDNHPWPQEQFERLCQILHEGGLINSVASEPTLGSPSRGGIFQSRAERIDDGWRINGHKNWSTGGRHLTHLIVSLDIEGKAGQILVPNDAAGCAGRKPGAMR